MSFLLYSKCCSYTSESVLGNTAQGVVSTTQKHKFLPIAGTLLAVYSYIFNSARGVLVVCGECFNLELIDMSVVIDVLHLSILVLKNSKIQGIS